MLGWFLALFLMIFKTFLIHTLVGWNPRNWWPLRYFSVVWPFAKTWMVMSFFSFFVTSFIMDFQWVLGSFWTPFWDPFRIVFHFFKLPIFQWIVDHVFCRFWNPKTICSKNGVWKGPPGPPREFCGIEPFWDSAPGSPRASPFSPPGLPRGPPGPHFWWIWLTFSLVLDICSQLSGHHF